MRGEPGVCAAPHDNTTTIETTCSRTPAGPKGDGPPWRERLPASLGRRCGPQAPGTKTNTCCMRAVLRERSRPGLGPRWHATERCPTPAQKRTLRTRSMTTLVWELGVAESRRSRHPPNQHRVQKNACCVKGCPNESPAHHGAGHPQPLTLSKCEPTFPRRHVCSACRVWARAPHNGSLGHARAPGGRGPYLSRSPGGAATRRLLRAYASTTRESCMHHVRGPPQKRKRTRDTQRRGVRRRANQGVDAGLEGNRAREEAPAARKPLRPRHTSASEAEAPAQIGEQVPVQKGLRMSTRRMDGKVACIRGHVHSALASIGAHQRFTGAGCFQMMHLPRPHTSKTYSHHWSSCACAYRLDAFCP